jgi:hypothetical protein
MGTRRIDRGGMLGPEYQQEFDTPPVARKRRKWGDAKEGRVVNFWLSKEEHSQLKDLADTNEVSMSGIMGALIREAWLKKLGFEVSNYKDMASGKDTSYVKITNPRAR